MCQKMENVLSWIRQTSRTICNCCKRLPHGPTIWLPRIPSVRRRTRTARQPSNDSFSAFESEEDFVNPLTTTISPHVNRQTPSRSRSSSTTTLGAIPKSEYRFFSSNTPPLSPVPEEELEDGHGRTIAIPLQDMARRARQTNGASAMTIDTSLERNNASTAAGEATKSANYVELASAISRANIIADVNLAMTKKAPKLNTEARALFDEVMDMRTVSLRHISRPRRPPPPTLTNLIHSRSLASLHSAANTLGLPHRQDSLPSMAPLLSYPGTPCNIRRPRRTPPPTPPRAPVTPPRPPLSLGKSCPSLLDSEV